MMKREWTRTLFCFLLFLVLVNLWVISTFNISAYPLKHAETFDGAMRSDYRDTISKEKPEIIVLGDSSISHLSDEKIADMTGKSTMVFAMPGTGSAYWYLFIRNQLFLADHRPDYFILFFRDSMLTVPEYRVKGEYFIRLEEIATVWDEDVYDLAINYKKPATLKFLERYVPIISYRNEIYSQWIQWSRNFLPELMMGVNKAEVDSSFEKVFGRQQINAQLWEEYQLNIDSLLYAATALDFSDNLRESFLPAILRELNMMGIQPVFVRVKYRSHALGEKDDPTLLEYLADLEAYLQKTGARYVDLTAVAGLSADMYADNFHIQPQAEDQATAVIAAEILKVLD
jgi:hypothetical protein